MTYYWEVYRAKGLWTLVKFTSFAKPQVEMGEIQKDWGLYIARVGKKTNSFSYLTDAKRWVEMTSTGKAITKKRAGQR